MYNGDGFSEQKFTAVAMTPAQFKAWVANVRTTGISLDAHTLKTISQRSTRSQLVAALPEAKPMDGNVYFTDVSNALFPAVVKAVMDGTPVELNRAGDPPAKVSNDMPPKHSATVVKEAR